MSRFLLTAWPLPGHLLPQVGIAVALRERGHEVAFYSGESARATIEQAGFELFAFQRVHEQRVMEIVRTFDRRERLGRPGGGRMLALLRDWLVETIPDQLADLRAVLGRWPADAIATDMSMWGPMLVLWEADRVPVALCSTFMGPMLPGPDARLFGLGPATARGRLAAATLTRLTELRAGEGLAPLQESVNRYTARLPLYIVGNIRALDFDRHDLPPSVHYVGNCAWYPDDDHGERWLQEIPTRRPWVHVTESTLAYGEPFLLRTAIDALAQEPVELILTTGEQRDEHILGRVPLPANVHVTRWLSHDVLLRRCAALVTLGGKSTVLAAAQVGVPMVLVPTTWDKPDNARRVTAAGAGIRLSARRLDAQTLRAAVRQVLREPHYRQAARRLADDLAAAPGPSRAAELLEQLVSGNGVESAANGCPAELRVRRLGGRASALTVERNQL